MAIIIVIVVAVVVESVDVVEVRMGHRREDEADKCYLFVEIC